MNWFDAHLDLAYLAVCGRAMNAAPKDAGGPDLPGCVTLPSLAQGNIKVCLGTVFTELGGKNLASYTEGDAVAAHRAGLAQIATYQSWTQRGDVALGFNGRGPLRIGILVECADPISG